MFGLRIRVCADNEYIHLPHTQQDQTALICAARETRTECVHLLVEAGADLDAIDDVRMRRVIFHFRGSFVSNELAAFNFPMQKILLGLHVLLKLCEWIPISLVCGGGESAGHIQDASTALLIAAQNGHLECVRLLALGGADMEVSEEVRHTLGFIQLPYIFQHVVIIFPIFYSLIF
jgi:ankyrin repeat protein